MAEPHQSSVMADEEWSDISREAFLAEATTSR